MMENEAFSTLFMGDPPGISNKDRSWWQTQVLKTVRIPSGRNFLRRKVSEDKNAYIDNSIIKAIIHRILGGANEQ